MVEPFTSSQVRTLPGCQALDHEQLAQQAARGGSQDAGACPPASDPQLMPAPPTHPPTHPYMHALTHARTHTPPARQVWMYCVGNHEIELTDGVKDFLSYETR